MPPTTTGILAGTTARYLLDHAGELGWRAAERMITPAELADADGAWFTSSVRGVAEIREHRRRRARRPTPPPNRDDLLGFD